MRKWIVILTLLVACSGGGFSEDDQSDFIAGCMDGGGTESACQCVWDKIEAEWDSDAEAEDDSDFQTKVTEFTTECIEEGS